MAGIIEKIKFYNRMIFMNRRSTIVMFLGLGISLALISQSLLFMYSFQYGAFTGFYNGIPTRQVTVSVSAFDIRDHVESSIPELSSILDTAIENAEIGDRIKRYDWFLARGFFTVIKNTANGRDTILPELNLYAIPSDYFSALTALLSNGSLPQKVDEVLVVASNTTFSRTNLSDTGTFPVYTPIFGLSYEEVVDMGIPLGGRYVNISGTIPYETFSNFAGNLEDDFAAMADYFTTQFLITSYTNYANIVSKIDYNPGYSMATGRVVFHLDKIDSFKLNNEISKLQWFGQEISREFESNEYTLIVYSQLTNLLIAFQKEFVIFQLFALLFITPIVGMSLSLTSYSANLMKRRQKRQVSSMLQRGSSRKEVIFVLTVQVVELTITALLLALVIGYAFSWLINQSTGFLNFSGASEYPVINMSIYYIVIVAGFILSLIINAKNVWQLSTITTHEAYSEHHVKIPLWERLYLDIVLISIGILLWIIVLFQLEGRSAYAFAYGFGTSAIVFIILGSILLATRLFPILIKVISKRAWKSEKAGIIGIATKRSSRRRSDVTRSLVLITLTFTLIFSSIITIQSYQGHDRENAYYQIGSDILVRNVDFESNATKLAVLGVEGVESATYLTMTSQLITYGHLTYSYIVLGINPTEFAQVAYFEEQYLRGSNPENFFSKIEDENDVVMQRDQLDLIDTYAGDQMSIIYEKYSLGSVNRTIDVVGVYKYFPRFYVEKPDPEMSSTIFRFSIVGTYENVEAFAYNVYSFAGDLMVKVKDGYIISEVAAAIELELGRTVDNVDDLQTTTEGSLRNTILYGSLNSTFIASLVITVSAIILMILIQIFENEREVITLKVLGMSPKQLFGMFLTDSMSVVIFGAIMGISVGIFAAHMFITILTFETTIPPTEMLFPPVELSIATLILLATATLSAALTSYLVFRKDMIKAIKQI